MQPLRDFDLFAILYIQYSALDVHLRMHARYDEPKRRLVMSIDGFGWSGVISSPVCSDHRPRKLSLEVW